MTEQNRKLRTPFKHDSRCAFFSLLSFVTTNSTPQREAQRMSCLKGVQRLILNASNPLRIFIKSTTKMIYSKFEFNFENQKTAPYFSLVVFEKFSMLRQKVMTIELHLFFTRSKDVFMKNLTYFRDLMKLQLNRQFQQLLQSS